MGLRILTLASTILLASGIALLLFYAGSQLNASRSHEQGIEAFRMAREARIAIEPGPRTDTTSASVDASESIERQAAPESGTSSGPGTGSRANMPFSTSGGPDQSLWSSSRIADYERLRDAVDDMPEGILRIPSVDLELPVFTGTEEANLTRGAGRIEGTAPLGRIGNTGVAAHRDGYFRSLKDVAIGDSIVVETLSGEESYRIDDLLIVDPEDTYVLDPTDEKALTLVTCYPFYHVGSAPKRFIVRATLR